MDTWDRFTEWCGHGSRGLIVMELALIAIVLVSALVVPELVQNGGENCNDSNTTPSLQVYEPEPTIAPTAEPTPKATPARLPEIHTIIIEPDFKFNPRICTITQNDCIIWVNKDSLRQEKYTLTSDDGLWQPADVPYRSDFVHVFGSTGNYTYGCYYFPAMKGTVIVREEYGGDMDAR